MALIQGLKRISEKKPLRKNWPSSTLFKLMATIQDEIGRSLSCLRNVWRKTITKHLHRCLFLQKHFSVILLANKSFFSSCFSSFFISSPRNYCFHLKIIWKYLKLQILIWELRKKWFRHSTTLASYIKIIRNYWCANFSSFYSLAHNLRALHSASAAIQYYSKRCLFSPTAKFTLICFFHIITN